MAQALHVWQIQHLPLDCSMNVTLPHYEKITSLCPFISWACVTNLLLLRTPRWHGELLATVQPLLLNWPHQIVCHSARAKWFKWTSCVCGRLAFHRRNKEIRDRNARLNKLCPCVSKNTCMTRCWASHLAFHLLHENAQAEAKRAICS